jgi:DNA-binding response OmpR family regulator
MTMPAADTLRAWRARPSRILVVEDATEMAEAISLTLTSEGFDVQVAHDGHTGLELARSAAPDVVLLDIDLPDIDGWEVCRQVRTFSDAYVVMLTVHADEFDRVLGLSSGADDYVTKPFAPRELVARIRAMLRRPRTAQSAGVETGAVHRFGELTIDTALREVRIGDRVVELSQLEYGILATLAEHSRQSLSRGQLLARVWGEHWVGDDHVIDVHVSNLRRKLGDDPRHPRFVRTVRGFGFRLGDG